MRTSAVRLLDTTRPLSEPGRWLRVAPFALAVAGGLLAAWLVSPAYPAPLMIAGGVAAAIVAATALPWHRWPAGWQAVPALALLPVAALVDYAAQTAGAEPGMYFLAALPVLWLALFHSRRLVLIGLVLLAPTLVVPRLLFPDTYQQVAWGTILLTFVLMAAAGLACRRLVQLARAATPASEAAARQAREDRDLLNAYLDNTGCVVVVLDPAGRVVYFNRYFEELTGYRIAEAVGQVTWGMSGHGERARTAFERVIAGTMPAAYEDDTITRSGDRRRIAWTGTSLVDEAGQVSHFIATGVDITDQRRAERMFTNLLTAAVEQMIFATDTAGRFTVFNTGGERLLGYSAHELVGKATVEDIHLPEDLAATAPGGGAATFLELIAGTTPDSSISTREWTLVRKDGSHIPVSMSINAMYDDGNLAGYVGVARDITSEREAAHATAAALDREREAANRLRELDSVKNDFVAMVSHDLRTPLTSIIGNVELLLETAAGQLSTSQRLLLETVDRNSRRLQHLIGDLLLLSRIDSGALHMNARPVAVGKIVTAALEAVSAERAGDIEVDVRLPDEPVLVRGDPTQLERVTINLVTHALRFTPPGGRVTVTVTAGPQQVRLQVSDNGIGIPTAELPHIFDRFYRSSRAEDTDRRGTGLGLTIAKSIVEQHGGTIDASAAPTGGTTFTVVLPPLATAGDSPQRNPA